MKISKCLIVSIFLLGLFGTAAAQQKSENSATDDFDNYDRGLIQTPLNKTKTTKTRPKNSPTTKPKQTKNQPATKTKSVKPEKQAIVGLPGIKVWFERQNDCRGMFSPVAPTSLFTTGDCVRVRFETNFEGYLKIINLGTSGNKNPIFPLKGSSDFISPKSKNYLPDEKGWEFTGDAGDEKLFFIVSSSPLNDKNLEDSTEGRSIDADDSSAVEVYDRDLTPRTENESVYVLANEQKLKKALMFRLVLKHR